MSVNQKLQDIQALWDNTAEICSDIQPDGDYVTKLESWEIALSKSSKQLQSVQIFTIMEGQYAEKKIYKFANLERDVSIGFFKGDCSILGFEPPLDITVLQEAITEFMASFNETVNIKLKTKGEYQNAYLLGLDMPITL